MSNNGSSNLFRVSEAANLALHSMAVLAGAGDALVTTHEIARRLRASEHHLAKVLLQLERAGLVQGVRGPSGGYRLRRSADRISLREVFEAIEGPIRISKCMFGTPVCGGKKCILGGFFEDINQQVADKLNETKVSEVILRMEARRG